MRTQVDLIPTPPAEIREGLYSVIAGALAGGAPEPLWVAVDDGTDSWVAAASNRTAADRARSVIAAGSDAALITAHRLGVGGAMRLPPSSLGALDAFAAADVAEPLLVPDCSLLSLIDGDLPLCLVTLNDREFWRAQLGDAAMTGALIELAAALDVPASILPWPALIITEIDESEIIERWTEVSAADVGLEPSVCPLSADGGEVIESASRCILEAPSTARRTGSGEPRPVHELPHGRRVGWWSRDVVEQGGDGWLATPIDVTPSKCRWRLEGDDRGGIVVDVLTSEELAGVGEVLAVRLPGWAARPLRPGSPTGLLAARIADAAARRGVPFWIPGVDEEALRFVLGLPGSLWVDGPAVPR